MMQEINIYRPAPKSDKIAVRARFDVERNRMQIIVSAIPTRKQIAELCRRMRKGGLAAGVVLRSTRVLRHNAV